MPKSIVKSIVKPPVKSPVKHRNKIVADKDKRNALGDCYQEASKSAQLRFKAALLEEGVNDECDYWKQFRETWQYESKPNRIPYVMVRHGIELLNYDPQLPASYNKMMETLQMGFTNHYN